MPQHFTSPTMTVGRRDVHIRRGPADRKLVAAADLGCETSNGPSKSPTHTSSAAAIFEGKRASRSASRVASRLPARAAAGGWVGCGCGACDRYGMTITAADNGMVASGRRLFLRRTQVAATIEFNTVEVSRRATYGLGALDHPATLEALTTLPIGEPVRWSLLTTRQQRVLRGAPPGVIERCGGEVTRLVGPPARLRAVLVNGRDADRTLTAASMFAPYCQRSVALPEHAVSEVVLLEAAYFGIGVYASSRDVCRLVAEPAEYVVRRWTWAQWLFQEQAWAQCLMSTSQISARSRSAAG